MLLTAISVALMFYVLFKSSRLRSNYIGKPLRLCIALERNIVVTRALLPPLILHLVAIAASDVHILVTFKQMLAPELYIQVLTLLSYDSYAQFTVHRKQHSALLFVRVLRHSSVSLHLPSTATVEGATTIVCRLRCGKRSSGDCSGRRSTTAEA